MEKLKDFFSEDDEKLIETAIKEAEKETSGEIRVHLEKNGGDEPMKFARKAFEKLGMRNTELHNGVLFVLAVEDRKFVILGDDGINQKVPDGFWNEVKDIVIDKFKKGLFADGLSEGIRLAGKQLATFFPYQKGDVDELSNAISYADEEGNQCE